VNGYGEYNCIHHPVLRRTTGHELFASETYLILGRLGDKREVNVKFVVDGTGRT